MTKINKLIFVLGMHRSGTSAVTRLINILGAEVGRNLLLGQEEVNRKGFWENRALIDVHDDLLYKIGTSWFDFRKLPEAWWQMDEIKPCREKILKILERDFSKFDLMVIKDPRICRLLPIWLNVLDGMVRQISCLLIFRNPLEVIDSLSKRNGFDPELSALLWLVHVLEAEYHSRSFARSFTRYDRILYNWETEIPKIGAEMDIQWPHPIEVVRHEICKEIDPSLRHHNARCKKSSEIGLMAQTAVQVYNKLIADNHSGLENFMDKVKDDLYAREASGRILADIAFRTTMLLTDQKHENILLEDRHQILQRQYQDLKEQNERLEEEYLQLSNTVKQHWSWRIAVRVYLAMKKIIN